jgi:hypothetical protein
MDAGGRRLNDARTRCAAILLAALCSPLRADGPPEGECDIELDPRMSLYKVMVGSEPFRDKRYLTWDDAVGLRDVLVSSGACARAAGPRPCKVELLTAGNYAVLRDGVNFDPHAELRTLDAARAYARSLEKVSLCKSAR